MIGSLLQPELVELIRERNFNQLREILVEFPAADIAEILADLSAEDKAVLLRILPHDLAADVFEYLSLEDQERLVQALGTEHVARILNDIQPDDRTALLEELPGPVTQRLLNLLSPEERKVASDLLGYPKDSIGRRMTPEYIAIKNNWTVGDCFVHLRREGKSREEVLSQLYVVDEKDRLVDLVRLRNLVVADPATPVTDLLEGQTYPLRASDDQETAIATFKKYDMTMLPVVDSQGLLVGVLTIDDVLDLLERETTEDIQKLGGSEALDEPYLTIALPRMIRKRAPWLIILFLSEMLTTTAMGFFEDEIARAVILALFLPLIISSGGNSGSQATTLIIRAIAIGEVKLSHWWRVMRREIFTGLTLGVILGVIGFCRVSIWHFAFHAYGQYWWLIGFTICMSLIGVIMWGSLSGSMLPFVLKRCGLDPATASAPFVATLVDVTGIVIYFNVAFFVLSGSLLKAPAPGVKEFGHKPSTEMVASVLGLDEQWDVVKVEFDSKRDVLVVLIEDTRSFGKDFHCKDGGGIEVVGHGPLRKWSYPDAFGHHVEIGSELPEVRCKNNPQEKVVYPEKIPWEDKGKPLSRYFPANTFDVSFHSCALPA
ncbi:MAG: magnesium transporter [Limisphaerales bacterium]